MINQKMAQYKAAIGKRNTGSDAAPSSMAKAQQTSIGRNRSSSVTNNNTAPTQNSKPRGSWEGYMQGSSAPIQMEGTGYLAKAAQKARGSKPGMNLSGTTPSGMNFGSLIRSNRKVFDFTHCGSKGSSISLLKEHTELNNLFKG